MSEQWVAYFLGIVSGLSVAGICAIVAFAWVESHPRRMTRRCGDV